MSDSIFGYWMRPSDTDETLSDYLWIGENGRMIHRINYKHGPFVMTLWYRHFKEDTYEVKLKPKSDWHGVLLQCSESELQMEHLDLLNPAACFSRIGHEQIPAFFTADLDWANRTMDNLEKKSK